MIEEKAKIITENLFKFIEKNNKVHVCDSYYIPTNTYNPSTIDSNKEMVIVEFKIKELKDWLFGLWISNYNDDYYLICFAQVERYISSYNFKPISSKLIEEGDILPPDEGDKYILDPVIYYEIYDMINYIKKNKNLAWCRDVLWLDYNYEYVTKIKALTLKNNYLFRKWREKKIGEYITRKKLRLVEKYILPKFNGSYIKYLGESIHPQYEIKVPLTEAKKQFNITEKGYYKINYNDLDEKYLNKLGKLENLEYKLIGTTMNCSSVDDGVFVVYNDKG